MHTCLLINDSEKASLKKSQRILAKYLPQIGPTTYLGPLSAEGLECLQRELQAARSRYLSVACYVVKHDLQPEIQFVVGNRKGFDLETGLYAHRTHTLTTAFPYVEGTYTAKLLARVIRVAALTHDIGKMNLAFQKKLVRAITKSAGCAEYIRHDAMSFLLLRRLAGDSLEPLKRLSAMTATDLTSLVALASADELKDSYGKLLRDTLACLSAATSPPRVSKRGLSTQPPAPESVLCALTAFLALTHHRLPGHGKHAARSRYTYAESFDEGAYFNMSLREDYRDCLTFEANVFEQDQELGQQLIRAVEELQATLAELPADFDLAEFVRIGLLHGRPNLVLADHLGSKMKSHEPIPAGALLANTRPAAGAAAFQAGDTLATHIRNVAHHARRQTQFALNLIANRLDGFPELSIGGQRNIDLKRSPTGKFAWQHEAFTHLKARQGQHPAFVAVTAGTGSGKTIASAQVMRALGSTRFTYALGLRSLTLQTGQSYKNDLGLMEADLAVVIGDEVARKAFEAQEYSASKLEEPPGSENLEQDDLMVATSPAEDAPWLEMFRDPHNKLSARQALGGKLADFIGAPVVVCTVDQLIGITQLRTVTKALQYRRVQSADLILDEVDNYSPAELKHLASLCFLVGYSRKNLVCLSATLGILHFEALFEAWQAGLKMNHTLTGLGDSLYLANVSNIAPPTSIELTVRDGLEPALTHVRAFNATTIANQDALPAKVMPGIIPCTARDYPALTAEVLRLHALNANAEDDRQVSAGFIRMNTVKSARRVAKHLFETTDLPADTALAVVCYHAKYSALELSVIDRALNTLTNRKRLAAGHAFSEAALQDLIAPLAAANPDARNLIIVVVTSSLIETGRDHDYDWSILEPCAHRSLIQSAGRVRRHRDARPTSCNLSLIETPDRALDHRSGVPRASNPLAVFSRPGPFTPLVAQRKPGHTQADWDYAVQEAQRKLRHTGALTPDIERDSSAHGFLLDTYASGVRNGIALQSPNELTNPLALVEQSVLHDALLHPPGGELRTSPYSTISYRGIQRNSLFLTDWAYLEPFRGTTDSDAWRVFLLPRRDADAGRLAVRLPPVNAAGDEANIEHDRVRLAHPSRSLLCLAHLSFARRAEDLLEHALGAELQQYKDRGFAPHELTHLSGYTPQSWDAETPETWYHPLLGFNNQTASALH